MDLLDLVGRPPPAVVAAAAIDAAAAARAIAPAVCNWGFGELINSSHDAASAAPHETARHETAAATSASACEWVEWVIPTQHDKLVTCTGPPTSGPKAKRQRSSSITLG
jgi:hypothetical protein